MRHDHKPLDVDGGTDSATCHDHAHHPAHNTAHDAAHEGHGSHGHGVGGHHGTTHRPEEKRRLRWAVILTASAMVVEVIGGIMTGSLALISDAGHMLTHAGALGVSLIAIHLATRPTSAERSFGLYRVEVLAAFFNAFTLLLISGFIAFEAWERLMNPRPILAWQMLGVATFGLAVNLLTALILYGVGKDDLNFRSAFLHMLGDTLSSAAIVVGAVLIHYTGWTWVDPILSVLICAVILIWAWGLMKESVHILLESAPSNLRVEQVRAGLRKRFDEIKEVDDIHIWTITSSMNAMTAYVELARELPLSRQSRLAHDMRHFVQKEYRVGHAVFQFEPDSV